MTALDLRLFHRVHPRLLHLVLALTLAACRDDDSDSDKAPASKPEAGAPSSANEAGAGPSSEAGVVMPSTPLEPGVPVNVSAKELESLHSTLEPLESWNADDLLDAYPVNFEPELGYDPAEAENFDLIQMSPLALSAEQVAQFRRQGFAILSDRSMAYFSYAYHYIYIADVPVFVSADSVLDVVHRSFDELLQDLEYGVLHPALDDLLRGVRARAASNETLPLEVRKDVDFFLAVAHRLLVGNAAPDGLTGDDPQVAELVSLAEAAKGIKSRAFLGAKRSFDFTQFRPRGHYTDDPKMESYFRAMMWLGRVDLRLLETDATGQSVLNRRQVALTLALNELLGPDERELWSQIDQVISAFVGEHDYMTVPQIAELQSALGIASATELEEVSDERLAQTIVDGNFGEQRIASQVVNHGTVFGGELKLDSSFALFGQRYTFDSHVFSQVVFDRVSNRVVPNPLDIAFATLGNNQAGQLLQDELELFDFAGNLGAMRRLTDAAPKQRWQGSLYNSWLDSLRALSASAVPAGSNPTLSLPDAAAPNTASPNATAPDAAAGDGSAPGAAAPSNPAETLALPAVAKTEAWGRRLLNAQLGSWSQLRHDTILYTKQSYTAGTECVYPDAYVEPYPEFWARLAAFSERGMQLVQDLPLASAYADNLVEKATQYFVRFHEIVGRLQRMSLHQLSGEPHSDEDIAFINDAVVVSEGGSGDASVEGWYAQLLYNPYAFDHTSNVVADVHTDPGGDFPVSRPPSVLHVGTAYPRLMVMSVDGCSGPRAYIGPVYAYKEHLVEELYRMTDGEWDSLLHSSEAPPDPDWLQPVVSE